MSASNFNVDMKDSIIVGGVEGGLLNVLSRSQRSVSMQDPETETRFGKVVFEWRVRHEEQMRTRREDDEIGSRSGELRGANGGFVHQQPMAVGLANN